MTNTELTKHQQAQASAEAKTLLALNETTFKEVVESAYKDLMSRIGMLQVDSKEKLAKMGKRQDDFSAKIAPCMEAVHGLREKRERTIEEWTNSLKTGFEYSEMVVGTKNDVEEEEEAFSVLQTTIQLVSSDVQTFQFTLELIQQEVPSEFVSKKLKNLVASSKILEHMEVSVRIILENNQKWIDVIKYSEKLLEFWKPKAG